MPTKREREYYRMGFTDGLRVGRGGEVQFGIENEFGTERYGPGMAYAPERQKPKKRRLSAWNKFVKANSKKPRFVLRSGKLNLKKMGVAFRKTPAGKKKRR